MILCHVTGDLGGLLGLFLGGSAISIFEIVDLVVYNLALQLSGYVTKRKDNQQTESEQEQSIKANTVLTSDGRGPINKHKLALSLEVNNGGYMNEDYNAGLTSDSSQLSIVDIS